LGNDPQQNGPVTARCCKKNGVVALTNYMGQLIASII
jgi:hypothetical protein